MEAVTIDLKKYKLSEDLAQDRIEWRTKALTPTHLTYLGQGFDDGGGGSS